MPKDNISQLLDGTFESPDGGTAGVATRALIIAPSLKGMELDLVRSLEPLPNGATKVYLDEQHIINLQDEYESVKAQLDAS